MSRYTVDNLLPVLERIASALELMVASEQPPPLPVAKPPAIAVGSVVRIDSRKSTYDGRIGRVERLDFDRSPSAVVSLTGEYPLSFPIRELVVLP